MFNLCIFMPLLKMGKRTLYVTHVYYCKKKKKLQPYVLLQLVFRHTPLFLQNVHSAINEACVVCRDSWFHKQTDADQSFVHFPADGFLNV